MTTTLGAPRASRVAALAARLRSRSVPTGLVVGLASLAVTTAILSAQRAAVGAVHVALVFLLVVLLSSARYGRAVGMVVSCAAFFVFNFYFIPPFHTLTIANPLDWLVLATFLSTGLVAAQLLHRAREEAALREAARAKDDLLAAVSHDLRTPLTSIRALAHEVAEGGDERGLAIEEETIRLSRFVSDLLAFSQLRAGGVRVSLDINAADDLMGAALQQVAGVAEGRDLRASIDTSEPVLAGRFDFAHALRIVVNLLENALKYSAPDHPVDFTVRRSGRWLVFSVADRGVGIPPDERDRVFEPFHRSATAAPDAGSAGLGLAIAKGLAEAQGGFLSYQARANGGSVFALHLPAEELVEVRDLPSQPARFEPASAPRPLVGAEGPETAQPPGTGAVTGVVMNKSSRPGSNR